MILNAADRADILRCEMMTIIIITNICIACYFYECINHSVVDVHETWAMLSVIALKVNELIDEEINCSVRNAQKLVTIESR